METNDEMRERLAKEASHSCEPFGLFTDEERWMIRDALRAMRPSVAEEADAPLFMGCQDAG